MGRSSRNSEEKVSFFAFQDIITAVIGILVLIALILALHVNPKREKEGDNPGNNTAPVELIEGENEGGLRRTDRWAHTSSDEADDQASPEIRF